MSLAQRVRDCRYTKGWGPDELASRASISRTALYQIESGKTELPRAGTLRRIALALDVSMESLLGHETAGDMVPAGSLAVTRPAGKERMRASEWISSEGGPLTTPATRVGGATLAAVEGVIYGFESKVDGPPAAQREHELARKLHDLLASPLGEGVGHILDELYRLLPHAQHTG